MSGRKKKSELEFGSDSFLDVLANIVGILIILIVIVGARLSRAPILSLKQVQAKQAAAQAAIDVPAVAVAPPPEPVAPPEQLEPDRPPPEIAAELQAVDTERSALANRSGAEDAALKAALAAEVDAARSLAADSDALSAQADLLAQGRRRLSKLEQALGKKRDALTGVLAEFEQVKHEPPKVVQVKHHLTPIGQSIVGEELHFRLSSNRVSAIPLKQLVDKVRAQIERQASFLARYSTHKATVGPVDGFSLTYVVERQGPSVLEEMRRQGEVRVRLVVAGWQVVPERDHVAETAEEALQTGSSFQRALMLASPRASLTFWVYPDSFGLFRKLQSAAHAEGFIVTARPLPPGVPIAGSPTGSRSVGQ